jgi:hypothetical protein
VLDLMIENKWIEENPAVVERKKDRFGALTE